MIKLFAASFLLLSLPAYAATIKSIKGNKATLKLSEDELGSVESDSSYDIVSKGANVGRIKISKIFPGKGLVGVLESKTAGINGASSVTLVPAKEEEGRALAKADEEMEDGEEETGIKPSYGRPEVESAKIGWDFNLQLGTHELKGEDSSDSVYASNVGLRGLYKFPGTPIGIGAHIKSNSIKRDTSDEFGASEMELSFTAFGPSVIIVKDVGNFRPYAIYEFSFGKETLTFRDKGTYDNDTEVASVSYNQNALILGGAWVFGKIFSVGLEYQAFGDIGIKSEGNFEATTVHSTGFSVNLGLSI